MLTLSAGRLVEIVGGSLAAGSPDVMVNGICIDSRKVVAGCAFVAFSGSRIDGHAHVGEALSSGARAAVVTRFDDEVRSSVEASGRRGAAVVVVRDAGAAVSALARYHRSRLSCPVVGITGSTGKTTTKDFLSAALSTGLRVTATSGNRNNELGVPLTVLEASSETDVLVVEMGMRGPGEIAALCDVARPDHGLVTNIGQTHIELLGSQERILHAKGELVRCLPPEGVAFLNGDDEWSCRLAGETQARVVFYGTQISNAVIATVVSVSAEGLPEIALAAGGERATVTLPVPGRHNAYNAAAAVAVAIALGVGLEDAAAGLARVQLTEWRMQVFTTAGGVTVINDAYNANPTSMRAAVAALSDIASGARRIAVLGDMRELGSLAELAHFRLGEEVAAALVDVLVTVGDLARRIGEGATAEGMDPGAVRPCATADEAMEVLDDILQPADVVLVKASRGMGLERVVEGIVSPRA
jgi:UDP-N-acetylmuramoyl-tripeptide--D-alanyl-D-alanine ligase